MLSMSDVEFYRENGYVVAPNVLDGATLSKIRQMVAEICDGARGRETHDHVYDLEPSHRPDAPRVADPQREMDPHPAAAKYLADLPWRRDSVAG